MRHGTATVTASRGVNLPGTRAHVDLPCPPSTNNLFATIKGRRVKSGEYRAWIKRAVPALMDLCKPDLLPCRVTIQIHGKVNRRRDGDNFVKPIMDALVTARVLPGDSFLYVMGCEWSYYPSGDAEFVRVYFG